MKTRIHDEQQTHVIGVAWYKQDQWPVLLQVSSDSNVIESTYEEWLQYAEDTFKRYIEQGLLTEKVTVDVFDLIKWCQDHNCPVNGESRASYVAETLYNAHKQDERKL
jgi:hypothetical protein